MQGFRGGYDPDDNARTCLIIVDRGKPVGFDTKSKIIRADSGNVILASQFTSMSPFARPEIVKVYRERLTMHEAEASSTDNIKKTDAEVISRALLSQGLVSR